MNEIIKNRIDIEIKQIEKEIDSLCNLRFNNYELHCLSNLDYMKKDYIQFLKLFKFFLKV